MSEDSIIRQRANSFRFAFRGIARMFRTQVNAWIHAIATGLVIVLGLVLHISLPEWIWVIFAIGFVLAAEAFNTAVELLVDLVSPAVNEKAGRVKDIAAGAVLIAAITAAIIGCIIFIPKF